MAEYDLTRTMSPYLDKNMVFPLLEFLLQKAKVFPEEDLLRTKAQIAFETNLLDSAKEDYEKLYKKQIPTELAKGLKEKRNKVISEIRESKKKCLPALQAMEVKEVKARMEAKKAEGASRGGGAHASMDDVLEQYASECAAEHIEALYVYARNMYRCGYYAESVEYLRFYLMTTKTSEAHKRQAMWGKVAAEILADEWKAAFEDLQLLHERIHDRDSQVKQREERIWLVHWTLFVLFRLEDPEDQLRCLKFLKTDKLYNTIQVNCPHILRYMAVAQVLLRDVEFPKDQNSYNHKNFFRSMKDFCRVLERERQRYSDPITEFLLHLYVEFDYDAIPGLLRKCAELLDSDYFLHGKEEEGKEEGETLKTRFLNTAKKLFFEAYCKLHQSIDIPTLAEQLEIKDDVEATIIKFIQETGTSAKLDSSNNKVIITRRPTSIFQDVVKESRNLSKWTNLMVRDLMPQGKN